jgi:hypothetical protein
MNLTVRDKMVKIDLFVERLTSIGRRTHIIICVCGIKVKALSWAQHACTQRHCKRIRKLFNTKMDCVDIKKRKEEETI